MVCVYISNILPTLESPAGKINLNIAIFHGFHGQSFELNPMVNLMSFNKPGKA
jgi:hypothetical protein